MHCVVLCILMSILASCQSATEWPETKRKFDVIFVIENEDKFKEAIGRVATESYMDEYNVHLGAIAFSQSVSVGGTIELTGETTGFLNKLGSSFSSSGTDRRLDLALDKAREMMDTGGRDDADKVVICMLTRQSDEPNFASDSAHNLRVAYIQIAAFGTVDEENLNREIEEITSDPLRLHKLFDPDIEIVVDDLGRIFQTAGICSDRRYVNSIHYVPDPANSNAFFQCDGVDSYIRKFCPLDQLWDKELVQCMPARKTLSKDDPCKYKTGLIHYGDVLDRNCAYFWICSEGRTIGYNCCKGNDTYQFSGDHVHTAPYATWRPVYSTPPYPVGNCEELDKPCLDDCPLVFTTVNPSVPPTSEPCKPDIYLTFNATVHGKGPAKAHMRSRRVGIGRSIDGAEDGYAGVFNGHSDLLSERFSHGWYGKNVEIFVRFRVKANADLPINGSIMLVSNGDCAEVHSIFLGYDLQRGEIVVKFNTTGGYVRGVIAGVQSYWIEVRVKYDGLAGKLTVDATGISKGGTREQYPQLNRNLTGNVRQTLPALHVGGFTLASTKEYNDLNGWIDKFWIYTCIPDPYYEGTEP